MRIAFISGFGSVEVLERVPVEKRTPPKYKVRDLATNQIMIVPAHKLDFINHTHYEINPGH